jgi:fibronectin-binding autotransporter adhesin
MRRRRNDRSNRLVSAAILSSAAISAIGLVRPALAAVDTWKGTVVDTNHGNFAGPVTGSSGFFNWNTTEANWSNTGAGKYTVGDDVVFTDNFTGGKDIDVTASNLNPATMTFTHIAGSTPTTYTLHASGDALPGGGTLGTSTTPFGTNDTSVLTLDTGFLGTVILRVNAVSGPSSGPNSTIIKSGTLEIDSAGALPNLSNSNNPVVTLAGGQLNVAAPSVASGQLSRGLFVTADSVLSQGLATAASSIRLWNGSITINSGDTLTVESLNGVSINFAANLNQAASVGTLKIADVGSNITTVTFAGSNTKSTTTAFDLGSGQSVVVTGLQNATVDLGALSGGANTTLYGSNVNGGSTVNFSIGARGDNTTFNGSILEGTGTTLINSVSTLTTTTSLTKVGTGSLTLAGSNSFTGTLTISSGTLALSSAAGSITGVPTISVATSSTATVVSTLRLDNTTNNGNRIADTATLSLNRGNLEYVGNLASATNETVGTLAITGGLDNVKTIATGSGSPAAITFTNFSRSSGVVNFDLDPNVNVTFTNAPLLNAGSLIGGYATAGTNDWATMSGNNVMALAPAGYTNSDGTNNLPPSWTSNALDINLTATSQQVVAAPATIGSLKLSGAGAKDISVSAGQSLDISSGGILATGAVNSTIEGNGTLTAGSGASSSTLYALVQDPNGVLTISAPIADNTAAGTVSLVKAGPGKLILGGGAVASTFTGSTSLLQGTLQVTVANFFANTSTLTLNFNTALDVGGFSQTFSGVNVINGSLLNSGGPTIVSSGSFGVQQGVANVSLAGNGSLTKTSTNIFTLNAANSYAGGTNVNAGTLVAAVSGAIPNGTLSVAGGTLDIGATNQTVGVATLTNGGIAGSGIVTATSYDLNGSTSFASTAVLSGAATLIKETTAAGSTTLGVATLSANNTYTGATTIAGGTLNVNSLADGSVASGIGKSSSAAANLVLSGGTLGYLGTGGSTNRQFTLSGTSAIANNGTGPITFSYSNAITVTGSSTLVLTGTDGDANTFLPDIPGATSLNKFGVGEWILLGAKTFTGVTQVQNGTLAIDTLTNGNLASGVGSTSNAASNLVFTGGKLSYIGTGATTDRLFTLSGSSGGTLDSSGSGPVVFNNTGQIAYAGNGNRNLGFSGSNTGANTFSPVITDVGAGTLVIVNKSGAGQWTLTSTNTYTGGTNVSGGTLIVNTNLSNGSLTVSGGTAQVAPKSSSNSLPGTTVLISNSVAADSSGNSFQTGTLNISGSGKLDLTNNALVLQYDSVGGGSGSPANAVRSLLAAGYAGGAWNGTGAGSGALVSSRAAASTGLTKTALGYAESGSLTTLTGATSFGGVAFGGTSFTGGTYSDVVVGYVYAGDANMDGNVNIQDFNQIANNFGSSTSPSWIKGDLNYDGVVNSLDLNAVATEFGDGPLTAPLPSGVALGALVPEPTSMAMIAAVAALGLRRRRAR